MSFVRALETAFQNNSSRELAIPMENYMKNHFTFYGIKTEKRRLIFKSIWQEHQNEVKQNGREITLQLFAFKEREMHYCGIEILIKNLKKNYQIDDIQLIEKILITNSWWDSVDTIAKYILGQYLIEFPNETKKVINRFSDSDNMWLNRAAILFQLGYKQKTNAYTLFRECIKHAHSKEFFIQKAIGWALREYGKYFPNEVREFVKQANLKPLSNKEALKNIS
ncbi:MAG: DNA alkylation repair protein [Flavobacterium sp.]|nr:DNA alkylation repair protein [Flavobacterium sp.]